VAYSEQCDGLIIAVGATLCQFSSICKFLTTAIMGA